MIIYLDNDYKCHVTDDGTMLAYETDAFDGKCSTLIEGYRFVPAGHEWTRPDGAVFEGEMISPWRDLSLLEEFQQQYEAQQAEITNIYQSADNAYNEGVNSI